jgi:hypothetical protein
MKRSIPARRNLEDFFSEDIATEMYYFTLFPCVYLISITLVLFVFKHDAFTIRALQNPQKVRPEIFYR